MIHDLFHAAAAANPAKTAVVGHGRRLSYAQLRCEALRLAQALRTAGASTGDRVLVIMPNSAEAAIAIWAVWEAGCVLVPAHAAARKDALLAQVLSAEPRWLIGAPELSALMRATLDNAPSFERAWVFAAEAAAPLTAWEVGSSDSSAPSSQPTASRDPAQDASLAALIYTSGSTGEPKGVMQSHANMQAALRAVCAYLEPRADDVIYSALPLASSYGLYQLIMGLAVGASVVLDRSFSFPAQSLALMANERATIFAGVPTMFAWLARTPLLDQFDLGALRILTSAAAALPIEHARRIRERLPHARLFVMYGQTECKRISYLDPNDFERKPGSVGRGMPFQEHAIVDYSGERVASGLTGELVVRGPHVMQGYWRAPEETARKLRPLASGDERWLFTGDLFRADEEGFLYYVGRRDELLKIGGHKVSPREIEEVLHQMPEIAEAAVVGVPDEHWGETARAHVVLKEGATCTEQDVIRFCSQRLRGYMVPRAVVFTRALPKTESGKVKKRELIAPQS